MAVKRSLLLLDRLRRAIGKVRFLLSFNATKWIVSAIARQPSGPPRLSFKSHPSLLDSMDLYFDVESPAGLSDLSRTASSASGCVSRTTSGASTEMSRTTSDASAASGDDINERAARFIANFHRQLEIERQVSLELRYQRERSLETTTSDGRV